MRDAPAVLEPALTIEEKENEAELSGNIVCAPLEVECRKQVAFVSRLASVNDPIKTTQT